MAVKKYIEYNPNFIFKIIDDGKDYSTLKKMVETNNLERFIIFTGWLDNKNIPSIIFDTDICIVPHHLCSHWETTKPNKLFDYMAARKPVVVSKMLLL